MTNDPNSSAEPSALADGSIVPDTKDWTWVLKRRCPDCGFAARAVPLAGIGAAARGLTARWDAALRRPDAAARPDPATWSVLEYGAHVRDVNRIFAERLRAILEIDYPMFANWDQDAASFEQRYDLLDPLVVAGELAQAASVLADRFDAVRPDQAGRAGRRTDGSEFTVLTLGQYCLHDVVHHLHDVRA